MIEHLLLHFTNIHACQGGKTKAEPIGSAQYNPVFSFPNSDATLKADTVLAHAAALIVYAAVIIGNTIIILKVLLLRLRSFFIQGITELSP
jgi:hypothetical protein